MKEGVARAKARQQPVLVSWTMPVPSGDPLDFFARGRLVSDERLLWGVPDRGQYVVGIGNASSLTGSGTGRFSAIASAWRRLLDGAVLGGEGGGPALIGGFAFDPLRPATPLWDGFPEGRMVLPRVQLLVQDGQSRLTLNLVIDPAGDADRELAALEDELQNLVPAAGDGPAPEPASADNGAPSQPASGALTVTDVDPERWMQAVDTASALIREGRLEKVVLAREVKAAAPGPISVDAALTALRRRYPGCYLFAVARGDTCFIGASPEQLIRVHNKEVKIMGLAATAPRHPTPDVDRRLGEELLADPKEREEHAIVVRAIRRGIEPLCHSIDIPDAPVLLRLHNVQHLFTPVRATLSDAYTLLDVVERLHPTPAVGGHPRDGALAAIRELENMDRGWYAAPVGWLNAAGDGEFAVGIRSALIRGREASLFSGCGIMGDSKAAAEFEESRVKLQPMVEALSAGAPGGDGV